MGTAIFQSPALLMNHGRWLSAMLYRCFWKQRATDIFGCRVRPQNPRERLQWASNRQAGRHAGLNSALQHVQKAPLLGPRDESRSAACSEGNAPPVGALIFAQRLRLAVLADPAAVFLRIDARAAREHECALPAPQPQRRLRLRNWRFQYSQVSMSQKPYTAWPPSDLTGHWRYRKALCEFARIPATQPHAPDVPPFEACLQRIGVMWQAQLEKATIASMLGVNRANSGSGARAICAA